MGDGVNTLGGALNFEFDIEINKLKQRVAQVESQFKKMSDNVTQQGKGMDSVMSKIGTAMVAYFSINTLTNLGRQIISVRSEFEKYQAVLTTSYGSALKATNAMGMLTEFAAKTPFQLSELTNAFVKLKNQGFEPTREQLKLLGDLASSTGKGIGQLAEAVLDAQVGEFERLKEFGIKAKVVGDKITFTFKEQSTTVDKSATSIRNYITSLGGMEGVAGSMASISETLGGKISNLGDAWDKLLNTLGKKGFWKNAVSGLTALIESVNELAESAQNVQESDLISWWDKINAKFNIGYTDFLAAQLRTIDAQTKRVPEIYIEAVKRSMAGFANKQEAVDYLVGLKKVIENQLKPYAGKKLAQLGKEGAIEYTTLKKELAAIADLMKDKKTINELIIGKDDKDAKNTLKTIDTLENKLKELNETRTKKTDINNEGALIALDKEIEKVKSTLVYYNNLAAFQEKTAKTPEKLIPKTQTKVIEIDEKTGKQVSLTDKDSEKMNAEYNRRTEERYEALFSDIDRMSRNNLKDRLVDLRTELTKHADNSKERIELLQKIYDVEQKLADDTYNNVMAIGDALKDIAGTIGGTIGNNIGSILDSIQKAYESLEKIKTSGSSGSNKIQGISGIVSAATTIIGVSIDAIRKEEARIKQMHQEIEAFTKNIAIGDFEYNLILRERLRIYSDLNKSQIENLKNQKEILEIQRVQNQQLQEAKMAELWKEQFAASVSESTKTDAWKVVGGILAGNFQQATTGKTTMETQWESLYGKTYEDIEKLFYENRLSERAKELFLQLQELKQEGVDVNQLLEDTQKKWIESVTGSTYDSILSGISNAFADGQMSVQELADFTEDALKKAAMKAFQAQFLQKQTQLWLDQFASFSEDAKITEEEKKALNESAQKIMADANIGMKQIEESFGVVFKGSSNQGALSGAISQIQEDTANIIAGQMNGIRIGVLEQTSIMMQGYSQLILIESNTRNLIEIRDILRANSDNSLINNRANGI